MRSNWLRVQKPLPQRAKFILGCFSFLLPIALWCVVAYVPAVWHPDIRITDVGSISFLQPGMQMKRADFEAQVAGAEAAHQPPPRGIPANPIYLPAPDEVATAFFTAFTTPPRSQDEPWLSEALWHSVQIIFWGFVISSAIGVPLRHSLRDVHADFSFD